MSQYTTIHRELKARPVSELPGLVFASSGAGASPAIDFQQHLLEACHRHQETITRPIVFLFTSNSPELFFLVSNILSGRQIKSVYVKTWLTSVEGEVVYMSSQSSLSALPPNPSDTTIAAMDVEQSDSAMSKPQPRRFPWSQPSPGGELLPSSKSVRLEVTVGERMKLGDELAAAKALGCTHVYFCGAPRIEKCCQEHAARLKMTFRRGHSVGR